MDRFDQYRVFAQVADMGSFIKAANALEVPRASVSAAIQQLETQLGVRLLHRTTRQVRLTADGEQLLERVRPLLAEVEDIDQLFHAGQRQVSGRLSIDAPSRVARRLIAPALPGLLRRHPRLELVLSSTDRAIDLVQEGVDCAVRIGTLDDSSLVVRPLGHIALINCASPDYLREQGEPRRPGDLPAGHWTVGYASPKTGRELPWESLSEDGAGQLTQVPARVVVNNAESYIACCLAGLGLIQIPRFDVQHLLDAGKLVEVMPAFRAAAMPVSLLYPHRRQRSRRLAVFHDWFAALMQPHLDS
ncbi:LysR family transcriptional regulator [Achromobacter marplatensis]|uniref:DNA-binding transcriptional LysR family regulator n=1 Tax=Achromobacter marplatensis TaxID=470868 RepID=A0ABX9GC98_9BURK|nr:LysR family transcriptional regulator [Achromobacter marplatensis]OWT66724.1 LysR family transcriptional regulator [Achromobacter marplatensis]RBP21430.1 DNA-binding transcriptional LysR family regulator [Achromobacter marplatensis]CAB3639857.1 HTH-type transcriptional regulator PgrR [Achromobacter marplatensis]